MAIDREGRARQRGRAQGRFVHPTPAVRESAAIAPGHRHIGQQMVPEGHRLRRLQMGEARHYGCGISFGLLDQGRLQRFQLLVETVDRVAHPEAEIGRDLVVAAARGMQPAGRVADQLGEPRLDVEMDILERGLEFEAARLDLLEDVVQARLDGRAVLGGDQALVDQHAAMRH